MDNGLLRAARPPCLHLLSEVNIIRIQILTLVGVLLLLCSCNPKTRANDKIFYDFECSGLNGDFRVEDGKVYIPCRISLTNLTEENLIFSMKGEFLKDYKSHLITSKTLIAFEENNEQKSQFSISGGKTQVFIVVFIGEFGGYERKFDRLPPPNIIFTFGL